MKFVLHLLTAAVIVLLGASLCPACPVSYSRAYTPAVEVTPVVPYVNTQTVAIVQVQLAQYSAYLAPAVVVPTIAAPVVQQTAVQQTTAVQTTAASTAAVATQQRQQLSADDCSALLAEIRSLRQEVKAMRQGSTMPPADQPGASTPPNHAALAQSCLRCHQAGKPFTAQDGSAAPALFDALGKSTMTEGQLRKATRDVESGKMPLAGSPEAKAITEATGNAILAELDATEGVDPAAATKPTLVPLPAKP